MCFLIQAVLFGSDDAETILLKAALLQVICLYQKVVPHVVTQYNFDFSKLLKGASQGMWAPRPPTPFSCLRCVCQGDKGSGEPEAEPSQPRTRKAGEQFGQHT